MSGFCKLKKRKLGDSNMRNLIFGGAGFVGANLVEKLLKDPQNAVHVFDNLSMGNHIPQDSKTEITVQDALDFASVEDCLSRFNPDRIYHLIANSDISASALNPELDLAHTYETTLNIVEAAKKSTAKEFVFASSSAVYGFVDGVTSENTLKRPESSYGWMKWASEAAVQQLSRNQQFTKILCVRFPNVTGRHQTHGVVYDLVRKLKNDNSVLQVLGDGSQKKPYGSVVELVDTINRLLDANWTGYQDFNIGPSDQITVRQIVDIIIETSKLNPKVEYQETRAGWVGDVPEYMFDTGKARDLVGKTFSSSESAVIQSVKYEWLRKN